MKHRFLVPILIAVTLGACDDTVLRPIGALPATYVATEFLVRPEGGVEFDVLELGGELVIAVDENGSTTGVLRVPFIVFGAPFNESMAGTATLVDSRVEFFQDADTFVRDLIWTFTGTGLSVVNQVSGDRTYTITLARHPTGPYLSSQTGFRPTLFSSRFRSIRWGAE